MSTDDTDSTCGADPHLHPVAGFTLIAGGYAVIADHRVLAIVPADRADIAARIVELLARHGFVDVPDTPAEVACPWPPPDPNGRLSLVREGERGRLG